MSCHSVFLHHCLLWWIAAANRSRGGSLPATFAIDPAAPPAPAWVDTDALAAHQALAKSLPALYAKLRLAELGAEWQQWMRQAAPESRLPGAPELTPLRPGHPQEAEPPLPTRAFGGVH